MNEQDERIGIGMLGDDLQAQIVRLLDTAGRADSSAAAVSALVLVMVDIAESLREINGYLPPVKKMEGTSDE